MVAALYSQRLAYDQREVPWHKDGIAFPSGTPLHEGMVLSKTDFSVGLAIPASFRLLDDPTFIIPPECIEDGTHNKALAVVRAPSYDDQNWAVLGHASEQFVIIQNADLVDLIQPLEKWGGLDTIGALDNGARFFVTFKGGSWDLLVNGKKDEQDLYLIVKNTHLPGACLEFQLANIRVVCLNTWFAADQLAVMNLPLAHKGDLKLVTKWVVDVLAGLPEKQAKMKRAAEWMASINMSEKEVKAGFEYAIPLPKQTKVLEIMQGQRGALNLVPELAMVAAQIDDLTVAKERDLGVAQTRILAMQAACLRTYQESNTVQQGTAWGGFMATTEAIDHVVRSANAVHQSGKVRTSNWIPGGERAGWKVRAFEYFTDMKLWKN